MSKLTVAGIEFDSDNLQGLSVAQLTTIYNASRPADKSEIKKFKDKPTGIARVKPLLVQAARQEVRATQVEDGRRRSPMKKDAKITVLADAPKKAGSKAANRHSKLKTGMTVGQAYEIGVTPEDLRYGIRNNQITVEGLTV